MAAHTPPKHVQRRYTDAQRAEIVEHYRIHGARPTLRKFHVSHGTLYKWAKRAGVTTEAAGKERTDKATAALAAKRKELRVKLLTRVTEMLDRMGEAYTAYVGKEAIAVTLDRPPAGVSKDLAITFGILYDKLCLEEGGVTSREEVRHDYSERSDEDLIREAEAILRDATHGR